MARPLKWRRRQGRKTCSASASPGEQVENSRAWYSPYWHYENEPETRAALDLIFADHFSRNEPRVFDPLHETLLTNGDHYMPLADLTSYCQAHERPGAWIAD